MHHIKYLVLVSFTFLAACDAEGNLGMEESLLWHERSSVEEKVAYFSPRCTSYGFIKGTPAFTQCVVDEIRNSKAEKISTIENRRARDSVDINLFDQSRQIDQARQKLLYEVERCQKRGQIYRNSRCEGRRTDVYTPDVYTPDVYTPSY